MIIGSIAKSTDDGMLHDFVWYVEVVDIFDEGETGLAAASVTTERNIRLDVRDYVRLAIISLLCDCLKEEVEGLYEPVL